MKPADTRKHIASVCEFWERAGPERWFSKNESFDANFRQHFLELHHAAARRECEHWMDSADGALALMILLDQFPRNCFRGGAHAYATDGLARHYARRAIEAGYDYEVAPSLRMFFYLPFEHSEDPADQARSVELHRALPGEGAAEWALLHRDIIARFGRFPHRNAALGRDTTPEEQRFLDEGGFAG
ncbi:DUF924 family protein [Pseudomonas sp. Hp2]|uniref:DUF924 family protein n=1 Tax=Pseudomonas sp. Hp2 TaxID=701189 RepID=UPI0011260290|nr:DUF924 family protein [Pseudomonas sp. Hp2]